MKRHLATFTALVFVLISTLPAMAEDLRRTPVVKAVEKVAPAVVYITAYRDHANNPYGRGRSSSRGSQGSGVIIDGKNAMLLTNAHVINGASRIIVHLRDGRKFEATMVGADPDFDLAVLKMLKAKDMPEVAMGDSTDLLLGETVIAIGSPYGYTHSVTTGVVSNKSRAIRTKRGLVGRFIQTDAAINPGNSGGPLLNIHGELVGINTFIRADSEGIGFAIPINKARAVVKDLVNTGHVSPIWLGLFGQDLDQATARVMGLKSVNGLLVTEAFPGTPASQAGIKRGDVLLAIDNHLVKNKAAYLLLLRGLTQNEVVTLKLVRKGKVLRTKVHPESLSRDTAMALIKVRWGFRLENNPGGSGAVVTWVGQGSPAERMGLQPGDIIHQVGHMRLRSVDGLLYAFMRTRMQRNITMRVQRGGGVYYAHMTL